MRLNIPRAILLIIVPYFLVSFSVKPSHAHKVPYTYYHFRNLIYFFEFQDEIEKFFDFRKGDVIADVGAGEGKYEGAFSLLFDSLTFYCEEIDPDLLSQRKLDKLAKDYAHIKGQPLTSTFHFCLGTLDSTRLPNGIFDKVIMISSFHEFTNMDGMLQDIDKKLKPGGRIYMLDAFSRINHPIYCTEGHRGLRITEADSIFANNGFYPVKMRTPSDYPVGYANALVFERDKERSQKYLGKIKTVAPWIQMVNRIAKREVAEDSTRMNSIGDSLKPHLSEIAGTYVSTVSWIRRFGFMWMNEKNYKAALNVFRLNVKLFPGSDDAWYQLGRAYQHLGKWESAQWYYAVAKTLREG